jgi:hypothetical protein
MADRARNRPTDLRFARIGGKGTLEKVECHAQNGIAGVTPRLFKAVKNYFFRSLSKAHTIPGRAQSTQVLGSGIWETVRLSQ